MIATKLSPLWVVALLSASLTGCTRQPPKPALAEPSAIPVSKPITRQITDYVDFTGRTEAVQSVDIRPRTTGYLVKMPFTEGSDVKAGDLLFEIDPRPYQAQLDQAQGQVNLYQAQLKLAHTTYARDRAINRITPGAVSQQQLDQDVAALDEADARVKSFEKNMEVFRLNHEFTKVVSPIAGMISRYYLTLGNLVNQDQTLLTTIVSLDPMYAYFDLDEPTMLRFRRAINEGRLKPRASGIRVPLYMGLQGEPGYPHEGEIDFVNNQLNPTTGSILVRGLFANHKPQTGVRLLSPGMFVRIRLPIGQPHPAILVIDRAISSDQGNKFVYVVDAQNVAQYRKVTTGSLQEDGLRVVTEGLTADDWVVVGGLQQVQPKTAVKPEQVPMPSLNAPQAGPVAEPNASPAAEKPAPAPAKPETPAVPPTTTPKTIEPAKASEPRADRP